MDLSKTGVLISKMRHEKGLTQKQVAEALGINPKTVSKWERGNGFPDIGSVPKLSEILGIDISKLLQGELPDAKREVGNMKRIKFYVCENCGNILTSTGNCEISCCGRKLDALKPLTPDSEHTPIIEAIETEHYVTFSHPMTKAHYISFSAFVRFDRVLTIKLYPEQNCEFRVPQMRKGSLYYYCTEHGLFEYKLT